MPMWWSTVELQNEAGNIFLQLREQQLGEHVLENLPGNRLFHKEKRTKSTPVCYGTENVHPRSITLVFDCAMWIFRAPKSQLIMAINCHINERWLHP
ncbi:hypothetical protein AVEN_66001-1 [Araneus ventricosus]|uniref:Uncharacterized protein n=1 Tax=Araneus ventricosus TaxID=182803 RepID=A0A4Y2Q7E2_ARAVE|nr:hypothetical protein AVEN_66001-1 [Araneus ventricosus]